MLRSGECAYIEFLPYYSAFGGHQQYRRHPYIAVALVKNDEPKYLEEIRVFEQCKLTLKYFEKIVKTLEFSIVCKEFFLSRPIWKRRYGVLVIRLKYAAQILCLRELLVTVTIYLLKKRED